MGEFVSRRCCCGCCRCACAGTPLTIEEFRQKFKVGDRITGWSTGKVATITAIGEFRFLFKDFRQGGEWVRAIEAPFRWKKVIRKK